MVEDKITFKKFIKGVATPKTAVKSLSFGIWIVLFVLLGFTIYRAFFMKTAQQQIVAHKGSKVEVTQVNKTSRFLIPFVEVGVEQQSDSDLGTYIRGGVRFEF